LLLAFRSYSEQVVTCLEDTSHIISRHFHFGGRTPMIAFNGSIFAVLHLPSICSEYESCFVARRSTIGAQASSRPHHFAY
jgi:hypothetical protein